MLSLMEYDEELHEQTLREEAVEQERKRTVEWVLKNGHTLEEVAEIIGLPLEEVLATQETITNGK